MRDMVKGQKFIDIDFETRSELDIKKVGAYRYAAHPSTGILMVSFSFDEGDVYNYDPYYEDEDLLVWFLKVAKEKLAQGWKIRAFNSMFEFLIWNLVGTRQFYFPPLEIDQFYCVMAEACAMGFPASLENCGKVLNLVDQKDKVGSTLIKFFSNPSRARGEKFKDPLKYYEKFMAFKRYCDQDVVVQIEVSKRCRTLSVEQYRTFILTEKMNLRGLPIDLKMIKGALELADAAKEETAKAIQKLTKGAINSPTQSVKLKAWLNDHGFKIANLKGLTVARTLARNIHPTFRRALELRKDGSLSSLAKYTKALVYIDKDGLVHDFIKYHIASTGRWGGRGIQVQNYSKPSKGFPKWYDHQLLCEMIGNAEVEGISAIFDSISESLKAACRGMIAAPEGFKWVGADYAQIEARIVMWLANDLVGLKDFSGDGKIYEAMAARIFQKLKEEIIKGSFERDIGKETVLGCGFGMGWKKFIERCFELDLNVPKEVGERAVKSYRERYKEVPKAWKACEKAALFAIRNPSSRVPVCGGRLVYFMQNKHLFCKLPSGRHLCYPFANIRIEKDNWGRDKAAIVYKMWAQNKAGNKWVDQKIWGGTLFQHSVQATAADVMSNGMHNAEEAGYETRFTVHDESAALALDEPRFNFKEYEKLLCDLPHWAEGMPIVAEGFVGYRYQKF